LEPYASDINFYCFLVWCAFLTTTLALALILALTLALALLPQRTLATRSPGARPYRTAQCRAQCPRSWQDTRIETLQC
jgi:hypothetical protein